MSPLSERDRAEVERSAGEARQLTVEPPRRDQIERYLNPKPDTAFPLEYSFSLLGDIRGKTVLDFGCASGENIVPLVERGARVTGIDISPDLIELARQRLALAGLEATLQVVSGYETGLPDASVDVIFCIALIHHLDIEQVRKEMLRILARDGKIILQEPIRFSRIYGRLRNLLPDRDDISEYEHPLTRAEFAAISEPFKADGNCYFRLPFLPLLSWTLGRQVPSLWKIDRWCLQHSCNFALCNVRSYKTGSVGVRQNAERFRAGLPRAQGSNPYTTTLFCVPRKTFPSTATGVAK